MVFSLSSADPRTPTGFGLKLWGPQSLRGFAAGSLHTPPTCGYMLCVLLCTVLTVHCGVGEDVFGPARAAACEQGLGVPALWLEQLDQWV